MVVSTMDPGLWICYCVDHTRLLYELRRVFVNAFSWKITVFLDFFHIFFHFSTDVYALKLLGVVSMRTSPSAPSMSRITFPTSGTTIILSFSGFLMLISGVVMVAFTVERSKAKSASSISQSTSVRFWQ